jgi:flagellar hook-associated protein 1 FlgK
MNSLSSMLSTLQSALQAQQGAINVTGQNVANVNTPGYVEQTPILETQAGGNGVNLADVQSQFNAFTFSQVLVQHGQEGAANQRSTALTAAQSILAPQGGGAISDEMNSFTASLQTLEASPSDPSARSAVLAQATDLAQSFSTTASGLAQQQSDLLTQAQGVASKVNTDLNQIAQLNSQIAQAQGSTGGAADLLDQRDTLVTDVADQIGAQVVPDANGSITLFAAGGVLVSGNTASSMAVSLDSSGALKITMTQPGGSPTDVTSNVTNGALGGIREARDTDIAQTANQLDQLAYSFSNAVNSVHESGYGLDGVSGRPLFTPPTQVAGAAMNMAVDPSVAGQPNNVAAAASASDVPGGNDVAVQLAQITDQSIGSGGTPAQWFGAIASQLGSATASANTDASTRADMVTQAENLNSSASGVSLNEEMTNLSTFQQGFEAATRVLQVTNQMLSDFMTTMTSAG